MQTVETIFREIHSLPPEDQEKLFKMLRAEQRNGDGGKHFQETATDEEWSAALHRLANEPVIDAPDIPDEALRRENIYTREDHLL